MSKFEWEGSITVRVRHNAFWWCVGSDQRRRWGDKATDFVVERIDEYGRREKVRERGAG